MVPVNTWMTAPSGKHFAGVVKSESRIKRKLTPFYGFFLNKKKEVFTPPDGHIPGPQVMKFMHFDSTQNILCIYLLDP